MEVQGRVGGWLEDKWGGEGGQRGVCRFSEAEEGRIDGDSEGEEAAAERGGAAGFHLAVLGMDGENDEKGGVCVWGGY